MLNKAVRLDCPIKNTYARRSFETALYLIGVQCRRIIGKNDFSDLKVKEDSDSYFKNWKQHDCYSTLSWPTILMAYFPARQWIRTDATVTEELFCKW